jgi:hypothetical protein
MSDHTQAPSKKKLRPKKTAKLSQRDYINALCEYTGAWAPPHLFATTIELTDILEALANAQDASTAHEPCAMLTPQEQHAIHNVLNFCKLNPSMASTIDVTARTLLKGLLDRAAQPPAPALPDAILNVAELLHTQDNRITANPLFAVEVKTRVYGIDPEWGGPVVWIHDGDEVTDPDELKKLEQGWENGDDEPDNYTRTSYHEHWEFVTACFTEEGCKAYLRSNGHNHRGEKRIYAHSGFRNREWEELRRYLMSLRPVPTKGESHGE